MEKDEKTNLVYDDKHSYVAKDNIWKDHVRKIDVAAKIWPQKWGFMADCENKKTAQSNEAELIKRIQNYKPIPRTASAWIGWKSTDERFKLEKYGSHAKARGSIFNSLKWPSEAII